MIKDVLKKEKGVSLVTLAVAIVILVIITNLLIYNAKDGVQIKVLQNLNTDISNLRDKVSEYYTKYGTVPKGEEYTNIDGLKSANILSDAVDTGKFYVIELSALDNLTLNFGEDYKNITPSSTVEEINALTDIYILNSVSQNVFYVEGISVDNKMYYTDYTENEKDTEAVKIRYYEDVKIPEGCTYVLGSKADNLTITDGEKEYTWVVVERGLVEMPTGTNITSDKEEEFLESVNTYGGYWKHSDTELKYIVVSNEEEYWSKEYDKEATYTDVNGDSAYIPKGFKVSTKQGMNKINNGLVVKDGNENEYVWISVPKGITIDCGPQEIEDALKSYAREYRKDGYEDVWYQGCGIATKEQYDELKQQMLNSIQDKGGFYIGRYEAGLGDGQNPKTGGLDSKTVETVVTENGLPVSQQDRYVYNYVTVAQAQGLANKLSTEEYNCSLMFGIQWNLVCKFIEVTGAKNKDEITVNSSSWGNYIGQTFKLMRGKYSINKGVSYNNAGGFSKVFNQETILTTGITRRNFSLNIYDLAGNMWENTLETGVGTTYLDSIKGGSLHEGEMSIAMYTLTSHVYCDYHIGFRVTIY